VGFAVGAWLDHDFDWRNHHLMVWRHDQPRPANWWSRRPGERPRVELAHATVWQPPNRPGPAATGLDRGYDSRPVHGTVPPIGGQPRPPEGRGTPAPPLRQPAPVVVQHPAEAPRSPPPRQPAPVVVQHPAEAPRTPPLRQPPPAVVQRPAEAPRTPPANAALIGVQSSRQTQQFSNRGQESRQTVKSPPAAPPARPSAPARSEAPSRPTGPGKR
jgi:hypothetical protein